MSATMKSILESWPELKDDLHDFLADTDAWIIANLKEAHQTGDWTTVQKVIEVMEMVHGMAHAHDH